MKKYIFFLFIAVLANSAMEEKQPFNNMTKENIALLKAKLEEQPNFIEKNQILLFLSDLKRIRMAYSNETTLHMLKGYLCKRYSTPMPMTVETQTFYPILCISPTGAIDDQPLPTTVMVDQPLPADDHQKKLIDIIEEQKTNVFMVVGSLSPLSTPLKNKIAKRIAMSFKG